MLSAGNGSPDKGVEESIRKSKDSVSSANGLRVEAHTKSIDRKASAGGSIFRKSVEGSFRVRDQAGVVDSYELINKKDVQKVRESISRSRQHSADVDDASVPNNNIKNNERNLFQKIITVDKLIIHRMAYMKMDPRIRNTINTTLFVLIWLLSIRLKVIMPIFCLTAAITLPFIIFIYPGLFYYQCYLQKMRLEIIENDYSKKSDANTHSFNNQSQSLAGSQRGTSITMNFIKSFMEETSNQTQPTTPRLANEKRLERAESQRYSGAWAGDNTTSLPRLQNYNLEGPLHNSVFTKNL